MGYKLSALTITVISFISIVFPSPLHAAPKNLALFHKACSFHGDSKPCIDFLCSNKNALKAKKLVVLTKIVMDLGEAIALKASNDLSVIKKSTGISNSLLSSALERCERSYAALVQGLEASRLEEHWNEDLITLNYDIRVLTDHTNSCQDALLKLPLTIAKQFPKLGSVLAANKSLNFYILMAAGATN